MRQIKSCALIGMGAIGGYLAANLISTLGDNLRIVASGARADRLRQEGIVVNGKPVTGFHVVSPEEKTDPADLVILITKIHQLPQALEDVRNQVGDHTIIMTPLNGVDSEMLAGTVYGQERVLYSLCRISVVRDGNALYFNPDASYLEFGETDDEWGEKRTEPVRQLFESSGIACKIPEDILLAMWQKYVCNCSENQILAVLGTPIGTWHTSSWANELRIRTAREVIAIARAKGIMIDMDYPLEHMARLATLPPENKPSTLQDLENRRKTEVEMFSGSVIRMGKELGIPTPMNDFLYHAIHVLEEKNEGKFQF